MTTFDFALDVEKKIHLVIPAVPDKFNYYYEPTNQLHKFDEGAITFTGNAFKLELTKDIINEVVGVFYVSLNKCLNNDLLLNDSIKVGDAGYALNNFFNDRSNCDVAHLIMWSSINNIATLLYNHDNAIYLEIVPIYPWIFQDPEPTDDYVSFDEFMKTYKPYAVEEIPRSVAIEWKNQCEEILKQINSCFLKDV